MPNEDSDQTVRKRSLILVFAGLSIYILYFRKMML